MTNRYLYITLLTVLGFSLETKAQHVQQRNAPRLVVSIAVDQLRSDYLEAFAPLFSNTGFNRLLGEGTVYANASYPFVPVDRASAIASITSGTTPYYNSVVGLRWLNRETLRPVECTEDSKYPGLQTAEASSPSALLTSTIGDELKMATAGKALVFSIAPFQDAAVLSAGHAANGALWIDDQTGYWCSSKYYASSLPVWVKAYNDLNAPMKKSQGITWEPISSLVGNFSYLLQTSQQKSFKHHFNGKNSFRQYKTSALVNADVTDMAQQCIVNTGMGNDKVTDFLSLTYYAGCFDHQPVTDCQMELQDTYVRLDAEIGRFIDYVERQLGRENTLFILTSTGCCDDVSTDDYEKFRVPSGTFYMSRTAGLLNMYLGAIWGQGKYVEAVYRNQFFLNHQLLESKKVSIAEAVARSQELLAMMAGVKNVYSSLQLLTGQTPEVQKIRNGYHPERCGDLLVEVAPGWTVLNEDTQESVLSCASYIQFPIIFYGADFGATRIQTPVTVDQIAPTIARSIRIRAPNACSAAPLFQ